MIDVDVQLACDKRDFFLLELQMSAQIEVWARAALESMQVVWKRSPQWLAPLSFHQSAQLTVRIVGEAEAATLNQDYRQRRGVTNVLSFPFGEPFHCQPPLLGDIVICASRVAVEARQQNKPVLAHWAHLVVHGVLHLLGYDHLDSQQAQLMEDLEIIILEQLGFPDPYVDRVSNG